MLTASGYLHKKSFKAHKDVVNCFVVAKMSRQNNSKVEKEFLFTGSSDKYTYIHTYIHAHMHTYLHRHAVETLFLAADWQAVLSY